MKRQSSGTIALTILASALFFIAVGQSSPCCTTAVVAGSATRDGRSLLWKNRDADDKNNQVVFCDDGKFPYIGIVNEGDAAGMEIWAGLNGAGFACMNAASYNLSKEDTKGEGRFMKLALQSCASVADFEALLDRTAITPRDVSANFGAIDAKGGAAYFEAGPKGYKRYDANDPAVAPKGYLVRTNFSDSGDAKEGTGFLRYSRAVALIEGLLKAGPLDAQSLLKTVARDVTNERVNSFAGGPAAGNRAWAYTGDSICRWDTASLFLAVGAKPGQDARLAHAWVIPGMPLSGAAVPVWPSAGEVPAELKVSNGPCALADSFKRVKTILYPDSRGDLARYMDMRAYNGPAMPVLSGLLAEESLSFDETRKAMDAWQKDFPGAKAVAALQSKLSARTAAATEALLNRAPANK